MRAYVRWPSASSRPSMLSSSGLRRFASGSMSQRPANARRLTRAHSLTTERWDCLNARATRRARSSWGVTTPGDRDHRAVRSRRRAQRRRMRGRAAGGVGRGRRATRRRRPKQRPKRRPRESRQRGDDVVAASDRRAIEHLPSQRSEYLRWLLLSGARWHAGRAWTAGRVLGRETGLTRGGRLLTDLPVRRSNVSFRQVQTWSAKRARWPSRAILL